MSYFRVMTCLNRVESQLESSNLMTRPFTTLLALLLTTLFSKLIETKLWWPDSRNLCFFRRERARGGRKNVFLFERFGFNEHHTSVAECTESDSKLELDFLMVSTSSCANKQTQMMRFIKLKRQLKWRLQLVNSSNSVWSIQPCRTQPAKWIPSRRSAPIPTTPRPGSGHLRPPRRLRDAAQARDLTRYLFYD